MAQRRHVRRASAISSPIARDPVFRQVAVNTFVYTVAATLLKMVGGLALALVMNQNFRFKNFVRAAAAAAVHRADRAVDDRLDVDPRSRVQRRSTGCWCIPGIANPGPSWLGNPTLAMISLIMVNTWRGLPFYAITLLAGLQTISPELYEAATIDGAGALRSASATSPCRCLKPVIFIVTMFSVIFTFADFQLVYVLTRGGPANATHAVCHLRLRHRHGRPASSASGASVALAMLPTAGVS